LCYGLEIPSHERNILNIYQAEERWIEKRNNTFKKIKKYLLQLGHLKCGANQIVKPLNNTE
jgi:hypothetical protein